MRGLARGLYRVRRLWLGWVCPITVGVRVVLLQEGQFLLVQPTDQSGWQLPGGGVKADETLEAATRRETLEETGASMGPMRLHGVFTNFAEGRTDHVAVFVCEVCTFAEKTDRWEIQRAQFFPAANLPEDVLPGHRRRIEECMLPVAGQAFFGKW